MLIGKIRMFDKTDKQSVDDVETEQDQVCLCRRMTSEKKKI